jgi:mono/diheme cytochrome c family protein
MIHVKRSMRTASTGSAVFWLAVFWLTLGAAWGQQGDPADDVSKGHYLAVMICSTCHVAAPDQPRLPLLQPPAPPFAAIAQRQDVNADALQNFMTTTHRGLDTPKGMPNPDLADYQIKEVVAYLLSLRK